MLMKNDRIRINCNITKSSNFAGLQAVSVMWLLKLRPPETVFMSGALFGGRVLRLYLKYYIHFWAHVLRVH